MESILIPLGICVFLPVSIVLINAWKHVYDSKKRTQIIMGAIEQNNSVDLKNLMNSLSRPPKTALEILNQRLLRGCIFSLIGLVLIIIGFVNLIAGSDFDADPVTVPLVFGGISAAVGASFLIVYFITRKQVLGDDRQSEK